MKVIDLLNKIANGEETPKRIYWGKYEFINGEFKDGTLCRIMSKFTTEKLNDEVEIIEDTPKEDKKIEDKARFQYSQIPSWFDIKELIKAVNENFEKHQKALDKIIDKINEGSEDNETN